MHRRVRLLLLAAALLLAGCRIELYTDLNEQEANDIVSALASQGIGASKQRADEKRWQVTVGEDELPRAVEVLRVRGLPSERYANLGTVFQKQGLVSTPAEERMRYIHAVSQELSQTLSKLDGVIVARVHVVIPANDPLSDKIRPSSAAVFIKHRAGVDLRVLVPSVKELVAHSIEGVAHDAVSLSLFESRAMAPRAPARSERGGIMEFLVSLSGMAAITLAAVMAAGAVALIALPPLLRKRGVQLRPWLRHNFRQLWRR